VARAHLSLTRGTQRHLRFGAEDGVRFSQYWKVTATTRRPELVISGNQTGSFLHLTMHEDEAYWHIRVTLPDEDITTQWQPPVMSFQASAALSAC
jgi:hypothetical protein